MTGITLSTFPTGVGKPEGHFLRRFDAWAAAARIILVSKVVRSRNPIDLAPILGLHSSYILVVLVICETLSLRVL